MPLVPKSEEAIMPAEADPCDGVIMTWATQAQFG
jgi:hypothetical protein